MTSASLHNRGSIDGANTLIQTGQLDLPGTGLLLGDHLSISARTVTIGSENGQAAVAAARQRLDLGVQTLLLREHALLHSEGDMAIGGQLDSRGQATGKANSMALSSARIEAMGDLVVDTAALSLVNAHFSSALRPDPRYPQEITEYQGGGAVKRYRHGTPDVYVYNAESDHLHTPEENFESWLRYRYTRRVQTEAITRTDPAVISVGYNFMLNADAVHNDKSTVTVGGQLAGTMGTLTNTNGQGRQIIHDAGSVSSFWRQHEKGRDSTGSSVSAYDPADQILHITLQAAEWLQHAQSTAPYRTSPLALPTRVDSSLFQQVVDPQAHYLVATDPRLVNYRLWLSSDYMLQQLSSPAVMHKRLGDGYYEQRLVCEQVAQLTGRRFLQGYSSEAAQFQALMNNGVTEARVLDLQPGIALSSAQMAQLTSNIVWLVKQQVTLPDGTVTEALLPRVYAIADSVTLNGQGTLIAASDLQLNVARQLRSGGTLAGWQSVAVNAQTIMLNGGQVYGDQVALGAQNDLALQGGSITGHRRVSLQAGHDLTLQSTTASTQSAQGYQTTIANLASVRVDGANAVLSLVAGNDLNVLAAQIGNSTQGSSAQLVAGRDLNLATVATASDQTLRWDSDNWRHDTQGQDVGSTIRISGDLTLAAGRDATLTAANLISDQGAMKLSAIRDISVVAGHESRLVDAAHQHIGKSGLLARNTMRTRDTVLQDMASGSTLSGDSMVLDAGRDLTVRGSNAVSTQATSLLAGGAINVVHAINQMAEVQQREERTTGLFRGDSFGMTLGVQQQNLDRHGTGTTVAATIVGATEGSVAIRAGGRYQQTGSQVLAPWADVDLLAQQLAITAARTVWRNETDSRFKQFGVRVALTTPLTGAIRTGQKMQAAASQTADTRLQALAAASTALSAKNGYDAIKQRPAQFGGVNLGISLGTRQNQQHTRQTSDHAAMSVVNAGGNVRIAAVGDAQHSDLTLQGSDVRAGGKIALMADHAITLVAAQNLDEQHSSNKTLGVSADISFGSSGLLFNASVNGGRGHADGTDVSWINSHVIAGWQLSMTSGSDSTLKGAVASGTQVTATVGGKLNLTSLQDIGHYDSKQQSLGGSITVGAGAMSGSVTLGRERMHSDFASVTEQSGIQAGDDGFQLTVKGNTDLMGALISSSDKAVQGQKNRFETGGRLAMTDLHNHAEYDADSASVHIGTKITPGDTWGPSGSGVGMGNASRQADSDTRSGISGIAGKQNVRTGDAQTGLKPIFDADRVQRDIRAQTQITQVFSQQAGQAVGDYVEKNRTALLEQRVSTDAEHNARQGKLEVLALEARVMHILIGAVTGQGMTAVTREGLSLAADNMRRLMLEDSARFAGVTDGQTSYDNLSADSAGVRGDGKKLGGTRWDLDELCGTDNARCIRMPDGQGLLLDEQGRVQFDPDAAQIKSLGAYLDTEQGKKLAGATGGIQGIKGTLFGEPYAAGSWQDQLIEAFAGSHDMIGGKLSGLYDEQGNARRGRDTIQAFIHDRWSELAIPVSAPFAMAELLPPQVWNAIAILLRAAK